MKLSEMPHHQVHKPVMSLALFNISFHGSPNLFSNQFLPGLSSGIDDLFAKVNCPLHIQVEFFLKEWHVNELDIHNCNYLLLHSLDLLENGIFMLILPLADIVENFFYEFV